MRISDWSSDVCSSDLAHAYYDAVGLGIDFTARDIQQQHKEKSLPWELAKAFDGSAPVSTLHPKDTFSDLYKLAFRLDKNGETVQQGNTADLIYSFEDILMFVSQYITLRKGDLIFTGTPAGVGPVDRKSKRLNSVTNAHSVCRLLFE